MKKIIPILLVLILLFTATACDDSKGERPKDAHLETVSVDGEVLKSNWKQGELIFDDKSVKIPCTVSEFTEKSGLGCNNGTVAPNETKKLAMTGDGLRVEITCKNDTDESIEIYDSTVIKYTLTNTGLSNRSVLFAGTCTLGSTRDAIKEALGEPSETAGEDSVYIYNGRNDKNKRVKLQIGINSNDIVRSVSYEIVQ